MIPMISHLKPLILAQLFRPVLVWWFGQGSGIVRRAVLKVCWGEVGSRVGKSAAGEVVLMVAVIPAMTAEPAMILVLTGGVMSLMTTVVLILESLVEIHLRLEVGMCRTAIE